MPKAIIALWGLVGLAVVIMASMFFIGSAQSSNCVGDMVLPDSIAGIGEFSAIDNKGNPIDQTAFEDGLNLLYFGYSFCPDICPIDTVKNAVITDKLAEKGVDITPYFITVDPARDDVEVMNDFVTYTHDKMIGITGSEEQMKKMQDIYGVFASRDASDDPEFYTVNHTGFSYLVDKTGLIAAYSRALTADQMVDNIMCHIEK